MRLAIALTCLMLALPAKAEVWTPPEQPDPQAILNEAEDDARARKYETALAKHVWFHENALKYEPSLSGVRLSFALSDWGRLGESYPPALAKLKEFRDKAQERLVPKEGVKISFDDFMELRGINRELGEEKSTVDAFRLLDAKNPDAAKRVFRVAEPALVNAKEYELCGKYIDSEEILRRMVESYRRMRKIEENRVGNRLPEFAKKRFVNDAAMLVALLVVNDRKAEAEGVVHEVKKEAGDAAFHAKLATELDKALKGEVPMPWP